jgi:Flp pilus assembly protein TadG
MPRLSTDRDRGAVSITVALLSVVLIGFAAIAVDVAALWADRQQLQTGADAAAIAVAQDCAAGSCGDADATAQSLAVVNKNDGEATAQILDLTPTSVTVQTTGVRDHWFASVLGVDESSVAASATVGWGPPSGGTAVLPVTFSWCEFLAQTGGGLPSDTTEHTIFFTKSSETSCTGPSGNMVPGGFGWLTVNADSCQTRSSMDEVMVSDPGESVPSGCTTADFEEVQDRIVLLPLYDESGDTGSNAWYRLYGYAAFRVTGYHFVGQYSWSAEGDCKGNVRCIQGYFTQFVALGDAFTYGAGAPGLGATVVKLTG